MKIANCREQAIPDPPVPSQKHPQANTAPAHRSAPLPSASSCGKAEHLPLKMHLPAHSLLYSPLYSLRCANCFASLFSTTKPLHLDVLSCSSLQMYSFRWESQPRTVCHRYIKYWESNGGARGQQVRAWWLSAAPRQPAKVQHFATV